MLDSITRKIEDALTRVVLGLVAVIVVAMLLFLALFYFSWAIYLAASQFMEPVYGALLVGTVLLLVLGAGFLVARQQLTRHSRQQQTPPAATPPPLPTGHSRMERMTCSLLAGFLYANSSSPETQTELIRMMNDINRQP